MTKPNSNPSVIFLVALLVGALVLASWLSRSFLQPLAFATIIGIGFYPLYLRIGGIVRSPNRSALLATFAVLFILVLPAVLIGSAARKQLISAARSLGDRSAQEGGAAAYLGHKQQGVMNWLGKYVNVEELHLDEAMANLPGQVSKYLLAAATGLVGGLAGFVANAVLTFLILFFVFRDGNTALEKFISVLPLSRERAQRLVAAIHDSVIANLYGIVAVGVAQGALTGVALAILRVPSALLFGLAAAVCSLIPIVGPSLVWLPSAIYLIATGHLWKGIFLILWGALVVSMADNVIRPLVIGSKVELHPLLLLFALLGGAQVFGFIGIFIGPVVISLIVALIGMLREELTAPSEHAAPSASSA